MIVVKLTEEQKDILHGKQYAPVTNLGFIYNATDDTFDIIGVTRQA